MFGISIIVFREVLEAALIIGIVAAATQNIPHRIKWILGSIGIGALLSFIVAFFAGNISDSMSGTGQELFNAGVLFTAVMMLSWHVVWMEKHGKELAMRFKSLSVQVTSGQKTFVTLAIAIILAVLREGAEIVLFLEGYLTDSTSPSTVIYGLALGLSAGSLAGFLLYRGLLRIPVKHFFSVTNWMIILLAGGMMSNAAGFLEQAGWAPSLIPAVWDSATILPEQSLLGQILHVLIGYQERPSGIQLAAFILTISVILTIKNWLAPSKKSSTISISAALPINQQHF